MNSGHRLSACPGPFANIRESRLQNHCVKQSNESRTNDCTGILYSDSEFMDLTGFLILAPPVRVHRTVRQWCYATVHLPSADISSGIFPSEGTRPIHFWKAERETLRLLYRTPSAELIQTFYRQINYLHAECESLWGTGMSACNEFSQQRQPAPE